MSVRVITKRQFSDGTTIDGNRIEGALQDVERFVDKVPAQFVKRRFTESMIVSGWSPIITTLAGVTDEHPWMLSQNQVAESKNPSRLKGYYRNDANLSDQYIWSQAFQPNRSVIIHALDLIMAHDTNAAPVYFMAGGVASPNYQPPSVTDIEIHITIDSPFVPEDRSQNDMEIHKRDFETGSWYLAPVSPGAPSDDMLPTANGGSLSGFSVNLEDLNIPIAPFSRVRFAVIIPLYGAGTGLTQWTAFPWRKAVWSQVLTILEPNDHA